MPIRPSLIIPTLLSLGVAGAAAHAAPEPDESNLVRVRVLAEHGAVSPGATVWLGLHFEIEDGWYTYWPGKNDSGFGTEIEPRGPESVAFGPVLWPAPVRSTLPGEILDHIHRKSVTALVPVTVSAESRIGSDLTLSFDLAWLVCKDVCIPGWETVSITLPVVAEMSEPNAAHAKVFADSRARIPRPLPETERPLQIEWDGPVVTLRARGAFRLAYYPDTEASTIPDLYHTGQVESDSIRLRPESPHLLSGVVEIFARDGNSRVFRVRSSPETPNG